MRILVTGVAGFLGSHLAERLIAMGHEVTGVDNMMGGDAENIPKGLQDFFYEDCCKLKWMKDKFAYFEPELVYHVAANPHEGLSVFSPTVVTRNTYLSTVAVASAACAHGVKRFVFTSSMSRYGEGMPAFGDTDEQFCPFEEWMPCHPVDPYGIAKVAAEQTLACLAKEHGMEYVISVPHSIVGTRQKYDDPYRNVASIMANLMLQNRQPVIYGDGNNVRCFSDVRDCIEPLVNMGLQDGLNGEVINIGPDDDPITINKLADMLAEIIGFKDLRPIYHHSRPCEVKTAWPSSDKARKLLGYRPAHSTRDCLISIVDWIREKGTKPFQYHLPLEVVTARTPKTWSERLF